MDKSELVNLLCRLNDVDHPDNGNCNNLYSERFTEICNELNCDYEGISKSLSDITALYCVSDVPGEWKYICLIFFILTLLNNELENSRDEMLSVQQNKVIKNSFRILVQIGITTRLHPNLPFVIKNEGCGTKSEDFLLNYNILKCSTIGLCNFLKHPSTRRIILAEYLKEILVAVYQLSFCPIKGPDGKLMTVELYEKLINERKQFLSVLEELKKTVHPLIFMKNNMIIMHASSPAWFKKVVSQTLSNVLHSKNGVEIMARTLLDGVTNDSAETWKIFEVFTKIILNCQEFSDFSDICKRVMALLEKVTENSLVFEQMVICFIKSFYKKEPELAKEWCLRPIISYFLYFTYKTHRFSDGEDITDRIAQNARILHSLFVENSAQQPKLPIKLLQPLIHTFFVFYGITSDRFLKSTHNDLKNILLTFFDTVEDEYTSLFDCLLFGMTSQEFLSFRNDVAISLKNDKLVLNLSDHSITYSSMLNSDYLSQLTNSKPEFVSMFFGFLLNCLSNKEKYFKKANEDLLNLETDLMNEYFERNITVHKLLAQLAEDKEVQKKVCNKPEYIIKYIGNVFKKVVELSTHKMSDTDNEAFQSFFTVLMILHNLVINSSKTNLHKFRSLLCDLKEIIDGTTNEEVRTIAHQIVDNITKGKEYKDSDESEVKTDLDKAVEDICDPLLPTRGHGLMTLTKLVQKKDRYTLERKQYVLSILQQNLKNEDSYIYLTAVEGLAAMADVLPDTILNILCDEYSDSSRKSLNDGNEVRMKLGESLVRVVKGLGDMAPKYKSLLLNTFLIGAKDDDDLIRASSLSNLGEVCKVLGYKLGSIITEILVCVEAIISTDKSPQARRAAVSVIRQLFVGLEKEMIATLKEDILPLYRSLKDIYYSDKDDVMRLQAQLALEELNENMKRFAFPVPQLSDKSIIVLKSDSYE